MRQTALGFLAVALGTASACAGVVEVSSRPQARPATVAGSEVQRPQSRPGAAAQVTRAAASAEQAAPVANPAFDAWVAGFRGRALAQGIRADVFDRAMRGVRYDPSVIARDRNQSEFKSRIWDYLDNAVSPVRVENGQAALRRHSRALARIEAHYGVEKEIVTGVWGLESKYGAQRGDLPLMDSLATLAHDGRRGAFFESQLVAALKIVQSGDIAPGRMTGSWAGAMGHTQFIPTSYLAYAVDFTGDGKRDIWSDDPTDALASTAAYLKRFGWTRGRPWGVEVRVPGGAVFGDAKRLPSDWAARGVLGLDGRPVRDFGAARILQPAGAAGPSFMIFANFDVIKRYNNSDAYALAVGHLADRIGGGPEIRTAWPRGYDPLSFEERKEMQRRLQARGYPIEKIDGIVGSNTAQAIRAYQASAGLETDGFPSKSLLAHLQRR